MFGMRSQRPRLAVQAIIAAVSLAAGATLRAGNPAPRNPNDPPDGNFDGYNYWLAKLNRFGGDYRAAQMVEAFLEAREYRSRFPR